MKEAKRASDPARQRTCGEALVHLLEGYGVDTVFGIPGEHTLELYRGIETSNVRHVLVRHEGGAGFMADGYARVTGRPGVCTMITGPGVTNAATPLAQAYADSVPLLLISSANRSESLGKGWGCLHEITDQRAVTAPLTAFSHMVRTPEDIPELIAQAFTVFHSRRPRPVHISIPIDLLGLPVASSGWQVRTPPVRPVAPPAAINQAAALLASAKRPVVLVGGGAQDAGACVTKLAEHLDAAVISSNAGKGVVPESHPLSLGGGLITKAVRDYMETADVILSIGCEISETDSFEDYLTINAKLIRIDIDPAKFNDIYPANIAVQGDAGPSVEVLLNAVAGSDRSSRGTALAVDAVRARQVADLTSVELQHRRLLLALREVLPPDSVMMGDIAQLVYTGSAVMPTDQPRTWFYPAGLGTLGCALPGAIGAKIAEPDRPVIALVGDGGLLFTIQELATAVEEGLGIPIILWNNDSLAMIRDGMIKRGIPQIGVNPRNPDFMKVAEGFGCRTAQPASMEAFAMEVRVALHATVPTVIEVRENVEWLA